MEGEITNYFGPALIKLLKKHYLFREYGEPEISALLRNSHIKQNLFRDCDEGEISALLRNSHIKQNLFRDCDEGEISVLLRNSQLKKIPAHNLLWQKGDKTDDIIIILKGKLKISLTDPLGNEFAIKHIVAVDSLGDGTITGQRQQTADVSTLEESLILFIPKQNILNHIKQNPSVAVALIDQLSARIENLTRDLELQVFFHTIDKISYKLLQLKQPHSDEILITHHLLAELVGMSREKLTLYLNRMESRGLIRKERGKIILLSPFFQRKQ